jgi:hypothetical protein
MVAEISTFEKWFNRVIAVLSIGIAVYFGLKSMNLEKEKYSIENAPKIKYANRLFFTSFNITTDTNAVENYHLLPHDSIGAINVPVKINISFNLKLTNIGNTTAKWRMPFIADVYDSAENPIAREFLLSSNVRYYSDASSKRGVNLVKEIFPKDTINLSVPKQIQNLNANKQTTIHIIFFYTGENNILYDTYLWVHLKFQDTMKFAVHNDQSQITDHIKVEVECCDTKIYTESEKAIIYRRYGWKDE